MKRVDSFFGDQVCHASACPKPLFVCNPTIQGLNQSGLPNAWESDLFGPRYFLLQSHY